MALLRDRPDRLPGRGRRGRPATRPPLDQQRRPRPTRPCAPVRTVQAQQAPPMGRPPALHAGEIFEQPRAIAADTLSFHPIRSTASSLPRTDCQVPNWSSPGSPQIEWPANTATTTVPNPGLVVTISQAGGGRHRSPRSSTRAAWAWSTHSTICNVSTRPWCANANSPFIRAPVCGIGSLCQGLHHPAGGFLLTDVAKRVASPSGARKRRCAPCATCLPRCSRCWRWSLVIGWGRSLRPPACTLPGSRAPTTPSRSKAGLKVGCITPGALPGPVS